MMGELQCEPENFTGRIIFKNFSTTLRGTQKGNDELSVRQFKDNQKYAERFLRGHWSFLGPGFEKKWYGTYNYKPDGSWDRLAGGMLLNFSG